MSDLYKPDGICNHIGDKDVGYDEVTCLECGWIIPSGERLGIYDGWFPSHEAHKEFKKYRTYQGMNEVKPIHKLYSPQDLVEPKTNSKDDALKLAIEFIESTASFIPCNYDHIGINTVNACKAALETKDVEPVAWAESENIALVKVLSSFMVVTDKSKTHDTPLYLEPPDQSARIAQLEAEKAELLEALNYIKNWGFELVKSKKSHMINDLMYVKAKEIIEKYEVNCD